MVNGNNGEEILFQSNETNDVETKSMPIFFLNLFSSVIQNANYTLRCTKCHELAKSVERWAVNRQHTITIFLYEFGNADDLEGFSRKSETNPFPFILFFVNFLSIAKDGTNAGR